MSEFLELLTKHRDEFHRYVVRTAWDVGATDDIFSGAVVTAWENWHKFTPGTNFRAWMYRIITNKCYVANRHTMRTPRTLDEVPESSWADLGVAWAQHDVIRNPESFLEQCGDEVIAAFGRLSQAQRSCILLRAEQFSYNEIAEILSIPVGTVMTHLARGRAKLRTDLLQYAQAQGIVRSLPRILQRDDEADDVAPGAGAGGQC